ncbi:adaptor protein MecA [uncultured Tyzzerella sp.]|uniref:adaptor protein MecA n=1 Tax=uncultured Tyzzerella sp. TaxID=2321398 RepID=UPI00294326F3|nr:adaptor protein MecA [uncultured Tyzzerella sp.]
MKIEKINENQIKFLLTNEDLQEREIKLSELAQGSEKAQAFFRDIMTEAMLDCGFDATNAPLMIEAMPVTMDTVMIIVSKVDKGMDIDKVVSLTPKSMEERKYKQGSIKIFEDTTESNSIIEYDEVYIYSFKNLDDIIKLSERLYSTYEGDSILYKYQDRYFLSLQKNSSFINSLEPVISEYGEKHISNIISKYYLEEHAEVIIKSNVLNILATI